jgi:hypothetical protein
MSHQAQFPLSRVLFMVASGLIALVGLFAIAAAQDIGITLFGYGLVAFGIAFGFSLLKRGFDEGEPKRG